jgi:thioredoxin 1
MNLSTITSEDFTELTLLDFWAEWCGPCRMLHPILDEIKIKNPTLPIHKINVDANKETAIEFGVRSLPTVLLIKDGQEVERVIGLKNPDLYQKLIDTHS